PVAADRPGEERRVEHRPGQPLGDQQQPELPVAAQRRMPAARAPGGLPGGDRAVAAQGAAGVAVADEGGVARGNTRRALRSEEHTSELQSREKLLCRLLLEIKRNTSQCQKPASIT